MSFKNLAVSGSNVEESIVQKVSGEIEEVQVQCGEEVLTLRGKITEILRSQGTSSGAVKMTSGGQTYFISSLRNAPAGVNLDAPAPADAKFESVYQGKAAQELLPHEEAQTEQEQAERAEENPTEDSTSEALPQAE